MSRVLLVCSSGGHLAQLWRLEPWWSQMERHWVCFDTPDAVDRLRGESVTWAHHPTTRNVGNTVRNLRLSAKVFEEFEPDLVVSNGAGVAVPFFVQSRRRKVPTVFIEVYDRVDSRTLTGRLCRPLSDLFLVQWPSQERLYPGSRLIEPLY